MRLDLVVIVVVSKEILSRLSNKSLLFLYISSCKEPMSSEPEPEPDPRPEPADPPSEPERPPETLLGPPKLRAASDKEAETSADPGMGRATCLTALLVKSIPAFKPERNCPESFD